MIRLQQSQRLSIGFVRRFTLDLRTGFRRIVLLRFCFGPAFRRRFGPAFRRFGPGFRRFGPAFRRRFGPAFRRFGPDFRRRFDPGFRLLARDVFRFRVVLRFRVRLLRDGTRLR